MDDLISRMDAVQATRVGPSDEWSRDFKAGYEFAATECMMNILKVLPADLSPPLGAVAMRDVASAVVAGMAPFYIGETRFADHASLAKQIPNIPLPDHAALLAAALKLPEVAAMRKLLTEALIKIDNDRTLWVPEWQIWSVDTNTTLADLEASHE